MVCHGNPLCDTSMRLRRDARRIAACLSFTVCEPPLGSVIGNCNWAGAVAAQSVLLILRFDDLRLQNHLTQNTTPPPSNVEKSVSLQLSRSYSQACRCVNIRDTLFRLSW